MTQSQIRTQSRMMKRLTVVSIVALAALWACAAYALPASKLNRLKGVEAKDAPDYVELTLTVEENRDLGALEPQVNFKSREVLLLLGNTTMLPGKKAYRQLGIDALNRVFTYQAGESKTAVKIVSTPKLDLKPGRVTVAKTAGGVVVRLWRTEPRDVNAIEGDLPAARTAELEAKSEPAPPVASGGIADAQAPIDIDRIFAQSAPKSAPNPATTQAEPEADSVPKPAVAGSAVPDLWAGAVKMASALVGVVGLIFLIAWVVRRYAKFVPVATRSAGGSGARPLRLIATAPLGLKKQVSLVEVAGELLVLGVSEQSVNLLARIEDPEVRRRFLGDDTKPLVERPEPGTAERFEDFAEPTPPAQRPAESPFARELRQYQQHSEMSGASEMDRERDDALRAIRERLAGMKRLQ
ncbi:MAG: flagellar biosynthetic protein FliO [Deltaproteobacteria bacterium]|nr:flagellar biosynthetic protein FliO [Deltaproteobacteria bacterium]